MLREAGVRQILSELCVETSPTKRGCEPMSYQYNAQNVRLMEKIIADLATIKARTNVFKNTGKAVDGTIEALAYAVEYGKPMYED